MVLDEQRSRDSSRGLNRPEAKNFLPELQEVRGWAPGGKLGGIFQEIGLYGFAVARLSVQEP